jgi:hypothetical protein
MFKAPCGSRKEFFEVLSYGIDTVELEYRMSQL